MRSAVAGGCLSAWECDDYTTARTTTGGFCVCHDDASGPAVDGLACTDGAIVGQCSGGICGEATADAGVQLMAAGCPESVSCLVDICTGTAASLRGVFASHSRAKVTEIGEGCPTYSG